MRGKRLSALTLAAVLCLLCGCGSLFDAEYVVETDYEPTAFPSGLEDTDTAVGSLEELEQLLLRTVMAGEDERRIAFDPGYEGDASADMASAVWQIRTQDALCAYCVENIAYDLSKIVNHFEAIVSIAYTKGAAELDKVVHLNYAPEAEPVISRAMEQGETSLVLLIDRSGATGEAMESFVSEIYRKNPVIAPREPRAHAEVITGADSQRLYEIDFDYGMDKAYLTKRREALHLFAPFPELDVTGMSEGERALLACRYLVDNCHYTENAEKNTVYAALIERYADSEGMAFGYVELCHRLGLDCQIVDGQYNREDHSWTIVQLEGDYYHVDPALCDSSGLEAGFLLNDEEAWGVYRWDYFNYPHCTGTLSYERLTQTETEEEAEESAEAGVEEEETDGEEILPEEEINS